MTMCSVGPAALAFVTTFGFSAFGFFPAGTFRAAGAVFSVSTRALVSARLLVPARVPAAAGGLALGRACTGLDGRVPAVADGVSWRGVVFRAAGSGPAAARPGVAGLRDAAAGDFTSRGPGGAGALLREEAGLSRGSWGFELFLAIDPGRVEGSRAKP